MPGPKSSFARNQWELLIHGCKLWHSETPLGDLTKRRPSSSLALSKSGGSQGSMAFKAKTEERAPTECKFHNSGFYPGKAYHEREGEEKS